MGLTATVEESLTKTITQATSFSEPAVWLSLHSANPGSGGTSEITNGTGPEARQQVTFAGSAGSDASTGALTFAVAAGPTVTWFGLWTAQTGGTFLGGFPMIGPEQVGMSSAGNVQIEVPAHGWTIGQPVRMEVIPGISVSAIPGGFTADTTFFVVATPTSDTVELSATSGGGAITPASSAGFAIAADQSQPFPTGGTLEFPIGGLVYATVS